MEKKITAFFEINVPKAAKSLAKFVGKKNEPRLALQYVCINPAAGYMAASDARELRLFYIEAVGEYPERTRVLVDPKHIANIAGKNATVAVYEFGAQMEAEIECDGEKFTTLTGTLNVPDFMRVVPAKENRRAIRLTPESVKALKTVCKLHKSSLFVVFDIVSGSDTLTVYAPKSQSYSNPGYIPSYSLKLADAADLTVTIKQPVAQLADCLDGCDGTITLHDSDPAMRPIMYEGGADVTILMPAIVSDSEERYIHTDRDNPRVMGTSFAEDAAGALAQLQTAAAGLWREIVSSNKDLIPGNYTAKEVAAAKCGQYRLVPPDSAESGGILRIKSGCVNISVTHEDLFSVLAAWEAAIKCQKSVFAVGSVEEVAATVMDIKNGGIVETKKKLRVLGDGWHCNAKRNKNSFDTEIYYKLNSEFVYVHRLPWNTIENEYFWEQFVKGKAEQIPERLAEMAGQSEYWARVAERCGITPRHEETPRISTDAARVDDINNFISSNGFTLYENLDGSNRYKVARDNADLSDWLTLDELWQWICAHNAPQPPETSPARDSPTEPIKRGTAHEKRQIGRIRGPRATGRATCRKSLQIHRGGLGANGYAMLDDASRTLENILPGPAKRSTANAP